MATPRKFSEKIALHKQKQAEGNAAFEAIMREVTETTKVSLLRWFWLTAKPRVFTFNTRFLNVELMNKFT